nr:MAG TPA: hypothetical protein [Caudoviricetes sp.]
MQICEIIVASDVWMRRTILSKTIHTSWAGHFHNGV